jgi:uncharacterized membrane protein
MRRDLALVAALAFAGLLAAVLQAPVVVRAVLLVPLVLVLPGYAIAANLFARGTIGPIERAVYSITLSIAVVAVGGLLIQLVLDLDRDVWAVFLAAVTIYAALRLRGESPGEPIAWPQAIPWPLPVATVAFVLAGVIAGLAIASAGEGLREAQAKIRFTDFWLLPDGAGPLASGGTRLRVGLRSHEGRPVRFGLQLSRDGRTIARRSLRLRAGEEWTRTFVVPEAPRGVPVLASLAREGQPYRRLDVVPPR